MKEHEPVVVVDTYLGTKYPIKRRFNVSYRAHAKILKRLFLVKNFRNRSIGTLQSVYFPQNGVVEYYNLRRGYITRITAIK